MKNLADIAKKESQYETYIDTLPEVIQEVLLLGFTDENGEWHKKEWGQDVPWLLAEIRHEFQELMEVIKSEKSRKNG